MTPQNQLGGNPEISAAAAPNMAPPDNSQMAQPSQQDVIVQQLGQAIQPLMMATKQFPNVSEDTRQELMAALSKFVNEAVAGSASPAPEQMGAAAAPPPGQ